MVHRHFGFGGYLIKEKAYRKAQQHKSRNIIVSVVGKSVE